MEEKLQNRAEYLHEALIRANNDNGIYPGHFTIEERWLINQERADIYRAMRAAAVNKKYKRYRVPTEIENKISALWD